MSRFYDIFLQLKLIWTDMSCSGSEMKNTLFSVGIRQEVVGGIKSQAMICLSMSRLMVKRIVDMS